MIVNQIVMLNKCNSYLLVNKSEKNAVKVYVYIFCSNVCGFGIHHHVFRSIHCPLGPPLVSPLNHYEDGCNSRVEDARWRR